MIRVLIVEDEPRVRRCLRQRLELEADLDVVAEAGDAEGALAAAGASEVDVVVLDVVLPGRDGFAVAEALDALVQGGSANPSRSTAPRIVLHTLHDGPAMHERAAAMGLVVIPKEGPDEPLLAAIRGTTGA
jgi:two-component system response regulator DesR